MRLRRQRGPTGQQKTNRRRGQPADGEGQRILAGPIHPLDVVDGNQHWALRGKKPHHVGDRQADQAGLR